MDGYGPGGSNMQPLGALAEDEARARLRPTDRQPDTGRWPSVGMMARVVAIAILAVVVLGWLLTAFNA